MSTFLTVKEAAKVTGKSASSIRRIIYPVIEDDNHVDRIHIQPSADEARQLRLKGENFPWRISEEFVGRITPVESVSRPQSEPVTVEKSQDRIDLLAMLQQELTIKNMQIAQQSEMISKQMELIGGLGERLREGNILIGSLQQRAALTDGREGAKEVVRASARKSEKNSESATKTAPKKRGLFARMFR